MRYDFSGYATKNDLKCSDGRVIKKDAFKHNDGNKVPLVWQHLHNEPTNILGHAVLENRADGVYAYCILNDNEAGKNAKELVKHGDITALSIYANKLKQDRKIVLHGEIREVSLVLTGANPGALIDNLNFAHSDGTYETDETEAVIYTGLTLSVEKEEVEHSMNKDKEVKHEDKDETVQDVFDTLNEKQKNVVYALLAQAMEGNDEEEEEAEHSDEGGNKMKKNVFEDNEDKSTVLSHADFVAMVEDSKKNYNGSLKAAALAHAVTYGIENIDFLFPDARNVTPTPEWVSREMGWVHKVLAGTSHTPFSRIKSMSADITHEEARARGYIKGTLKKEEFFALAKRITTPTTIYKKQKLDRDDIIDITDIDVVAWLKAEMRMMLDEELARSVLVGDGRDVASEDKISETNIRPIFSDADLYSHHIALANNITTKDLIDEIVKSHQFYKGSGSVRMYTTTATVLDMLLLKDSLGRRLYNTKADLAAALLVEEIVEVPVMAGVTRIETIDLVDTTMSLVAILVNLKDYKMGADKGGAVNMFDDFDIDYNQFKYLIETRCSGALVKPKSAIVIEKLPLV